MRKKKKFIPLPFHYWASLLHNCFSKLELYYTYGILQKRHSSFLDQCLTEFYLQLFNPTCNSKVSRPNMKEICEGIQANLLRTTPRTYNGEKER